LLRKGGCQHNLRTRFQSLRFIHDSSITTSCGREEGNDFVD
jgi:hypothetical protein